MHRSELKKALKEKQGYLKAGPNRVSKVFGVSKRLAKQVITEVKQELRTIRPTTETPVENPALVFKRDEALKFVAEKLIAEGKVQEAIDILTTLQKETITPQYSAPAFKDGTYVVLGCTHLPFNNKPMWEATCQIVRDIANLQGVVLAGDILDMHSISRHSKGKIRLANYTLGREYKEANIELDKLDKAIGDRNIKKEYFYGNHEDWYNAWGKDIDNAQLGTGGAKSPYEACFRKRGYNTQFNWKTAKVTLGDLEIIHGEWCNKHAAHKHAAELHRNIAFFHTHRMGSYYESNIMGLNCGWGGDKNQQVFNYMSRPMKENWRNGILIVEVVNNKAYPTILDYKDGHFLYNNKLY